MQPFNIHILGCGSALPTKHHNPSAQIVEIRGKLFMIDCGEGTQAMVRRSRMNFSKLYAIFITHIHGDHVLGLIGMLSTFGLQGRTAPLHVYAPEAYGPLFKMELEMFCSTLDYEIIYHPVDTTKQAIIYEDRSLTVETIPLKHRMPCAGFLFREKQGLRHINPNALKAFEVPVSQVNNLRNGLDWTDPEGNVVANEKLTTPADPVRSYAYCSDTRYKPDIVPQIKNVTMIYHEATYCEDMKEKAEKYLHSTAREAALIAKDANVGTLLLGHYSQRYIDEQPLLDEAKEVFPNSFLTNEGKVFQVK
ncbi:MAG: ribonuclease Z [Prevotella sp.]|nr:ribonuclease Z [Candidatus Prevotella equi]